MNEDFLAHPEFKQSTTSEASGIPSRIALCLSGGGYRSAIFYLGSLRRLHELGVMSKIDTISSDSGGSIAAGFLAKTLIESPTLRDWNFDWEDTIGIPFRKLVVRDIITIPALIRLVSLANIFTNTTFASELLAKRYSKFLTSAHLSELPIRPMLVFCASDQLTGVNWIFSRTRVGDWRTGYARPKHPYWSIAHAVGASANFPPVLDPIALPDTQEEFSFVRSTDHDPPRVSPVGLQLSDGGVYDKLGIEPVWKSHDVVLVSDGGSPLTIKNSIGQFSRVMRIPQILMEQISKLRKRWLVTRFEDKSLEGVYGEFKLITITIRSMAIHVT